MKAIDVKVGTTMADLLAQPHIVEVVLPSPILMGPWDLHMLHNRETGHWFVVASSNGIVMRAFHRTKRVNVEKPGGELLALRNLIRDERGAYFFKYIVKDDAKLKLFLARDRYSLMKSDKVFFWLSDAYLMTLVAAKSKVKVDGVWHHPNWSGTLRLLVDGVSVPFIRNITFNPAQSCVCIAYTLNRKDGLSVTVNKDYADRKWQTSKEFLLSDEMLPVMRLFK